MSLKILEGSSVISYIIYLPQAAFGLEPHLLHVSNTSDINIVLKRHIRGDITLWTRVKRELNAS